MPVVLPGEKALNNLSVQPGLHAIARKPYSEALSPKAVLELQPVLETVVKRTILKFEGLAKSGQVGASALTSNIEWQKSRDCKFRNAFDNAGRVQLVRNGLRRHGQLPPRRNARRKMCANGP